MLPGIDLLGDDRFRSAYLAGKSIGDWGNGDVQWGAYMLCWAADKAASLPGDFVEYGVSRGSYALTICKYLGFENLRKQFYLIDTYKDQVEDQVNLDNRRTVAGMPPNEIAYEGVVQTFKSYKNVKIINGLMPQSLSLIDSKNISFLFVTMNKPQKEILVAEYLWDKMERGSVVVVGNYGSREQHERNAAFNDFAHKRGLQVLPLPSGQGLIVK